MQEEIEKEIISLEEELKQFKTSQALGSSNSIMYPIVENMEYSFSLPASSYRYVTFTFTSNARPFPRMSIKILSATLNGSDVLSSIYVTQAVSQDRLTQPSIYTTRLATSGFSGSSARTLVLRVSIYADTTGIIETGLGS